jgi:hypothetical protein
MLRGDTKPRQLHVKCTERAADCDRCCAVRCGRITGTRVAGNSLPNRRHRHRRHNPAFGAYTENISEIDPTESGELAQNTIGSRLAALALQAATGRGDRHADVVAVRIRDRPPRVQRRHERS